MKKFQPFIFAIFLIIACTEQDQSLEAARMLYKNSPCQESGWDQRSIDECYIDTNLTQISECNVIRTKYIREWCYKKIAIVKNNTELCEEIKDQLTKDKCYGELARLRKDYSLCEKLKIEEYDDGLSINAPKSDCFIDIALLTKDRSVCEKMNDSYFEQRCLGLIASATKS